MAVIFHKGDLVKKFNITYKCWERFSRRWGKKEVIKDYEAPSAAEAARSYKSYMEWLTQGDVEIVKVEEAQ
jgi:hypothetical protein